MDNKIDFPRVGRPPKFKTVEEFQDKIAEYFRSCWTQKIDMYGNPVFEKDNKGIKTEERVMVQTKPYTITGLAVFLGTTRDLLLDYEKKKKYSDTVKRAKSIIYAYAEEFLYSGKNPTGAIFNLKYNWNWSEKTEIDLTTNGESILQNISDEKLDQLIQSKITKLGINGAIEGEGKKDGTKSS